MWRGVGEDTTNMCRTGDDYDDINDPALAAPAVLSESEPTMPFRFGGKEAAVIAAGYAELVFAVFTWSYPTPEKKNVCGCGQDDWMMRKVGRRDTRKIGTVEACADAEEIQDNKR